MKQKYMRLNYLIVLAILSLFSSSLAFGQTLKHSYTFETGTYDATTVYDQTGSLNATINGTKLTFGDGKVKMAGSSSNKDGYLSLSGADLALNTYSAITVEIMMEAGNQENVGRWTMLAYFGSSSSGSNCLWFQPARQPNDESHWQANSANAYSVGNELDDNKKHHVVGVLTSSKLSYYLDGVLVASATTDATNISGISTDVASIFKGPDGWADPNYNGSIAEFNIYDGALAETTIAAHAGEYLGLPMADATLSDLTSNKGVITYDSENKIYTIKVEYGTPQITLKATPTVDGVSVAMQDGTTNEDLQGGVITIDPDNGATAFISVTALNGISKEDYYVLIENNPASETASLTNIQLSSGSLLSEFDMDSLNYTALVPYGTTFVTLTGVKAGSKATVTGDGLVTLTDGVGSAEIKVVSEDGNTTKTYKVKIAATKVTTGQFYYIVHESSDLVLGGASTQPQLVNAKLDEGTQLFEFVESGVAGQYFIKNKVPEYLATKKSSNVWDMTFLTDLSADLDTCRFILLEFEPGRFRIETVARKGAGGRFVGTNAGVAGESTYNDKWIDNTLAIWNILPPTEVVDPIDTHLSSLSIDGGTLRPAFDAFKTEYYVTLPKNTTSLNIAATALDANTTVTGTGVVSVSGKGVATVTVTSTSDSKYSTSYNINYQYDTELTLKHQYKFVDGANDAVGTAHGTVNGGTFADGIYTTSANGDYITLPAADIKINEYPSITLEAYVRTGDNGGALELGNWTMLAYFGNATGGSNTYWMSIAGKSDKARAVINQGGEIGADGIEPGADENHHYVSVLTNDSVSLYIDGILIGRTIIPASYPAIHGISTDKAWLCHGAYNDPSWIGSIYEFSIYSGQMDKETIAARSVTFPSEVGISQVATKAGSKVYPTISNSIFNVELSQDGKFAISVFDLSGKKILEQANVSGKVTLNVEKTGMYIVKVIGKNSNETFKVFKTN